MQFFFCSAFLFHFCEIHRIDRGKGHFRNTLIVCVGIVHTLYFSVNLSYYFNFKSPLFFYDVFVVPLNVFGFFSQPNVMRSAFFSVHLRQTIPLFYFVVLPSFWSASIGSHNSILLPSVSIICTNFPKS